VTHDILLSVSTAVTLLGAVRRHIGDGPGISTRANPDDLAPRAWHDSRMGTARVLIVDDHAGFRSFARSLLESEGYVVVSEAEDGRSAIAAVSESRPDVVLLDVQLPDMDGFEVTRRLLASPDPPPIVLTSTRDAADYGQRLESSGARGFIPKSELSGSALETLLEGP